MTVSAAQFHKINLGSALQREEMKVAKLKHKRYVRSLACLQATHDPIKGMIE